MLTLRAWDGKMQTFRSLDNDILELKVSKDKLTHGDSEGNCDGINDVDNMNNNYIKDNGIDDDNECNGNGEGSGDEKSDGWADDEREMQEE